MTRQVLFLWVTSELQLYHWVIGEMVPFHRFNREFHRVMKFGYYPISTSEMTLCPGMSKEKTFFHWVTSVMTLSLKRGHYSSRSPRQQGQGGFVTQEIIHKP